MPSSTAPRAATTSSPPKVTKKTTTTPAITILVSAKPTVQQQEVAEEEQDAAGDWSLVRSKAASKPPAAAKQTSPVPASDWAAALLKPAANPPLITTVAPPQPQPQPLRALKAAEYARGAKGSPSAVFDADWAPAPLPAATPPAPSQDELWPALPTVLAQPITALAAKLRTAVSAIGSSASPPPQPSTPPADASPLAAAAAASERSFAVSEVGTAIPFGGSWEGPALKPTPFPPWTPSTPTTWAAQSPSLPVAIMLPLWAAPNNDRADIPAWLPPAALLSEGEEEGGGDCAQQLRLEVKDLKAALALANQETARAAKERDAALAELGSFKAAVAALTG